MPLMAVKIFPRKDSCMSSFRRLFRSFNQPRRQLLAGAIGLLTGLLLVTTVPTMVAQTPPFQQQRQQIEQQKQQIQKERDRLEGMEQNAQKNLSGIRKNIQATTAQISNGETNLKQANAKLQKLEADLTKAEATYRQQQSATVSRLQYMQRQRGGSGLGVLLQSENLNDFLDRRQRLKQVFEADRKVLNALKGETDKITKQRNGVEQQKNRIAILTQQLMAQKHEYQNQAAFQRQNIVRLKTDKVALEAAYSILSQDSVNLTELIRQRVRIEQNQAVDPGGVVIIGTGQISFPVNASITSDFGYRMHPILGYAKFHSGIDFGADYGEVIRATAAGVVIFAGWYGGYGNTVIVDHGNGITSLYAHAEGIYAEEGQQVQRGEPIALVGSTGLSTGPHLHFEVRSNGEPIDPLPYL
jgi:murein DD-endopeptidase MepM/ murein hydrolase activator NlpD